MRTKSFNIFLLITITILISSCNADTTCRKSRDVLAGIHFYSNTKNQETGIVKTEKLSVEKLSVNGLGIDSLLVKNATANSIKLPFNPFSNESAFILKFDQIIDTVTVKHQNSNYLLSFECGYIRVHTIDTVISTHNFIDSIAIIHSTVNPQYIENIQLHHIIR